MKDVIVIGGGLSGLAAAEELSQNGFKVLVLEKEDALGGLARSFLYKGKWIPITYHHVMSPDVKTIEYLKRLGLWDRTTWKTSPQSFWYEGKEYLLSRPEHIFRFSPLRFKDKLKLLRFGIYCWMRKDWSNLSNVDCETWLKEKIGEDATDILFKNLMDIKFNMPLSSISMAWLGRRLHQSVRNRDRYGYPEEGIHGMVKELERRIIEKGGEIKTSTEVTRIENGSVTVRDSQGNINVLDGRRLVSTIPPPALLSICHVSDSLAGYLNNIRFKSIISMVCGSDALLTKYYWSVMLKPSFSFGGIFNHTVLNDNGSPEGKYLYYLFTYLDQNDPMLMMDEADIRDVYLSDIRKIHPGCELKWSMVFKLRYSQPIFARDYENPPIKTDTDNLYLAGVYKEYPSPRTMDAALRSGFNTARYIIEEGLK